MEVKVYGFEEIKHLLDSLSPTLKTKILIKALQKISKPLIDTSKGLLWSHIRKGRLYRSMGEVVDKQNITLKIGARRNGQYKGYHAHFLEDGTKEREYQTKSGKIHKTGRVKGVAFWSASIDQNKGKTEDLKQFIFESFEKEVNRLYKKSSKL